MIGEVVHDALRAEHYAVDWVKDGAMAQTALATAPYDLLLLDLGLPRQDGLTVLRALRAQKQRNPFVYRLMSIAPLVLTTLQPAQVAPVAR